MFGNSRNRVEQQVQDQGATDRKSKPQVRAKFIVLAELQEHAVKESTIYIWKKKKSYLFVCLFVVVVVVCLFLFFLIMG